MKMEQVEYPNNKALSKRGVLVIGRKDLLPNIACAFLMLGAFLSAFSVPFGRWFNYVRYAAVLGFLLGVLSRDRNLFGRFVIVLGLGFLFSLYYYHQLWHLFATFPAFMAKSMLCWVYACFSLYYRKYGDQRGKKRLRTLWMVILVVTSITTVISVSVTPNATRALANAQIFDDTLTSELYRGNTATWGIMYGMVFTLPMWIAQFKRTKDPWYMVVIVAVMVCATAAQITFAFLFAVAFILSYFLRNISMKRMLVFIVLLILFMLAFKPVMAALVLALCNALDSPSLEIVRSKVYLVYLALSTGQYVGDADVRLMLYANSFMTFLRNPLFGVYMRSFDHNIIGLHSQICDVMGATGLLGSSIFAGIFIYIARKAYIGLRDSRVRMYFSISVMVLVLFMFVNPVWYAPESFMSVFLLPHLIEDECG